jgi:sodium transport system permease protein
VGNRTGLRQAVKVVARKELLDILRDRRSLFVLLLLPVGLYPLLLIGTLLLGTSQSRKLADRQHTVWVEGLATLPDGLVGKLRHTEDGGKATFKLDLLEAPTGVDYSQALAEKRTAAVLRGVPTGIPPARKGVDAPTLEVLYTSGVDASGLVRRDLIKVLKAWSDDLVDARLTQSGLPLETLEPISIQSTDKGPPGALLARGLAAILVMLALTSAFYPALDLGAGEKERGTLETLLLAPVPRIAIALGKFVAVFVVTFVCALLHVVSMGGTLAAVGSLAPGKLDIGIDPWIFPSVILILLPLVALFSAIALALATFAASYKEGQAYLTPVMLLGTLPALVASIPGIDLTPALCLVPVLGATLLMKALMAGTWWTGQVVLVMGSNFVYAALAIRWVASLYEREEVLWRPAAAQGPDLLGLRGDTFGLERTPTLPQALAMGIFGLMLLFFVGVPMQTREGFLVPGLILTLVGLIAVPPIAYSRLLGCNFKATFRFLKPSPLALLAAALLAVGCLPVVLDLVRQLESWAGPLSPEERKSMVESMEQIRALGPGAIVVLALLPAICEEIMFRGFVLSGLRRGGGKVGPILVTSLMFAVFHLDPGRLAPTFLVGVVLGVVVVRSGSIFPAMLLHLVYNASGLGVDHFSGPLTNAGLLANESEPTWLLRGLALTCLVVGGALLWRVKTPEEPVDVAPPKPEPLRGRVVIALATRDFDTTEVVVPWNAFRRAGLDVVFATEDGRPGACDPKLLTGVLFGQLGALAKNVTLYRALEEMAAFQNPIRFDDLDPQAFSALVLPGGHAAGMKQYLESETLQTKAQAFLAAGVPVGAICHGTLVLSRAVDPETGKSALEGRTVTALTKVLERLAYWITAWRLGGYYRTYPAYVQDEVHEALGPGGEFKTGPLFASYSSPFVVNDQNLVTARWPGDAQGFADALLAKIRARPQPGSAPSE